MKIKEGDTIPDARLTIMTNGMPARVSTTELTAGKKTVIVAVPGAYTPTCSIQHLPSFVDLADEIKAKGVDQIVCISVNDVFVMDAWGRDRRAEEIVMAADGNAEFTEAMGLVMDGTGFGLGKRSQRYAMIVEMDGTISKLLVEEPGAYAVSSAETILNSL